MGRRRREPRALRAVAPPASRVTVGRRPAPRPSHRRPGRHDDPGHIGHGHGHSQWPVGGPGWPGSELQLEALTVTVMPGRGPAAPSQEAAQAMGAAARPSWPGATGPGPGRRWIASLSLLSLRACLQASPARDQGTGGPEEIEREREREREKERDMKGGRSGSVRENEVSGEECALTRAKSRAR